MVKLTRQEGVRVGIGPENAAQGLAGVSDEAWCAVQMLLYAVEVSNQSPTSRL